MSLVKRNVPQWTDSRITAAVAERLSKVHPRAKTKVRPTARYVSECLKEYEIYRDGTYWKIFVYKGGDLPPDLKGSFWMTFADCERSLCAFLRRTDKFGRAIYPGSPYLDKVANASRNNE